MIKATPRQRRATAALIAKVAEPITADEAGRFIRDLKREELSFPGLLEGIVAADHAGDTGCLGALLADAKRRMAHGAWLPTLRQLNIGPRRAQRAMSARRSNSTGRRI